MSAGDRTGGGLLRLVEWEARGGVMVGVLWMAVTTLLFVSVTVVVRYVGDDVSAPQAAFLRYAFGVLMILPLMGPLFARPPSARIWWIYAARGLFHGVAVILWFYAMARISIAEVTALGYTAPIFVTLGAALFLGERLYARRIAAVAAAFFGALLVLRPGFQEISLGQLAQLSAAPLFAASYLIAKRLTDEQDPGVIVGMLSIFCTLVLLPPALLDWRPIVAEDVALLALTAAFATAGHYTMTRALGAAPLTVIQPVQFLQLVWATLLGVALFGEPVDGFVVLGGAVVVGAATFIAHRETRAARRAATPPAAATKT